MDLAKLDHLARQQKFEEANSKRNTLNSKLEQLILEARILLWKLSYEESWGIIREVESLLNVDQKKLKFICLLTKIHIFWVGHLGDKQDNINSVFEGLETSYNSFTTKEKKELSSFQGIYFGWMGNKKAWRDWDLKTGISYFKEAKMVFEQLGYEIFTKNMISHIGLAYTWLGDLNKGLDLITQASQLNKKYNLEHEQLYEDSYIAMNYHFRGDIKTSLDYFLKSYQGHKKYGSNIYDHIYRQLISLYTELGKSGDALIYLEEFKNRVPKPPDTSIEYLHAIILRKSQRGRDKAMAQEFFSKRVYDDNIRHIEFSEAATFYLETLFEELEAFGGNEILEEIQSLSDRMQTLSEQFGDKKLLITTLIGKSKIAFITGDLQNTERYLNEAESLIKENNFKLFFDQLELEKEILENNKNKILDLGNSQADIRKKMDLADYKKYLDYAKRIAGKF